MDDESFGSSIFGKDDFNVFQTFSWVEFKRLSDDFNFVYNNLSTSVVKGDYGSIIVNRSKTYFSYSFISNIHKSKYNCGIYIQTNYFTKIESCFFCNFSRSSTD